MPRESAFTTKDLTDRALHQFWVHGYQATSMDALVTSTQASRHAIYAAFGGKKQLFHACFDRYQDSVVSPAFDRVEHPDADLSAVAAYFETQIALAETNGLPGPGCFVANSSTEMAPHDDMSRMKVAEHNARLHAGFENALSNERQPDSTADIARLATVLVIFTNGLWSMSRTTPDAETLRAAVRLFLATLKEAL